MTSGIQEQPIIIFRFNISKENLNTREKQKKRKVTTFLGNII